jgi:hypothetical protein
VLAISPIGTNIRPSENGEEHRSILTLTKMLRASIVSNTCCQKDAYQGRAGEHMHGAFSAGPELHLLRPRGLRKTACRAYSGGMVVWGIRAEEEVEED